MKAIERWWRWNRKQRSEGCGSDRAAVKPKAAAIESLAGDESAGIMVGETSEARAVKAVAAGSVLVAMKAAASAAESIVIKRYL